MKYVAPAISSLLCALSSLSLVVAAEDAETPQPPEEVAPWEHSLKLGAFLNQSAAYNEQESRDPTINASKDAVSYRLTLDGSLTWTEGHYEVDQDLRARYGRVKEDDEAWSTNSDELRYDINGLYAWEQPHFVYLGGRVQTVFEEPEPGNGTLTPGLTFLSSGYGQRHKNIFLDESDQLEAKVGIRAQRRWGSNLTDAERDIEAGIEARVHYTNVLKEGVEWHLEAETFVPFDDMGHITTWAEVGVQIEITKWLTASLSARAYYETQPDDVTSGQGYDELSLRQTALIGFTWTL